VARRLARTSHVTQNVATAVGLFADQRGIFGLFTQGRVVRQIINQLA
jgi:hypothetical protein